MSLALQARGSREPSVKSMSLNRTFTEESETDGLEGGIAANGFGKPGSNRLVRALVIVNLQVNPLPLSHLYVCIFAME